MNCGILQETVHDSQQEGRTCLIFTHVLTLITRADAPIVVTCHPGGNMGIETPTVCLLFPPRGTRMSNCTSHETGQDLNYLYHRNPQARQTKTFVFSESVVEHLPAHASMCISYVSLQRGFCAAVLIAEAHRGGLTW